ncbi:MAG: hypothetical protein L0332_22225 [Chloroflexi bacterium]|nr:hypothetical protein [Chloroflexota bacterium]MCI0576511.1 hypothetical protein [Chloroflexota bacterium]MCI0650233.1 hypothetical protein [Chloroflexota bacterium]MCI0729411.1 hypothetical protein [Chloroflexota bacterium]
MHPAHVVSFIWPLALVVAGCSAVALQGPATPTTLLTPISLIATLTPSPSFTPSASSTPLRSYTPTPPPSHTPTPPHTYTPTPPFCLEPGQVVAGRYPSRIAGPERSYRVYLPPCYGQDGHAYPTLYLFHGNIHDDSKWDELGLDEAANAAILAGDIPPLLIVMPDGGAIANNSSGGPSSFEDVVLTDLIPFIEATTCAWPAAAGRAIGGLSRGGYWALEIAFRNPTFFTSAGGHSAALLDTAAGPAINPQQTGLTNNLGRLRIYLDIGRDDYLIANVERLHEEMAAAGRPHTWVLNDGRHEDAYWSAHLFEYLAWYSEPWPRSRLLYPPCG